MNADRGRTRMEHRRYSRQPLQLPVHYKFLEEGEMYHALETRSDNLGAKGLAMISDRRLKAGQHLMLTLFLPSGPRHGARAGTPAYTEEECLPVMVLSRVVWCRAWENKQYRLGVEFVNVEGKHRKRLERFLSDFALDDRSSAHYH